MMVLGNEGFLESPHALPWKKRQTWSHYLSVHAFIKILDYTNGHQVIHKLLAELVEIIHYFYYLNYM